jgi:NAD(P)-dependent dehydrogenase (short-subunit alcohol dehydrogenase family)
VALIWSRRALLAGGVVYLAGMVAAGAANVAGAQARSATATGAAAEKTLTGKTALVTGSTGGLGRAVALQLAARGAHVIAHGRDRERGAALVKEIAASGGNATFYAADLADLAQVRTFAKEILANHSRLDLLINNAGIGSTNAAGERRREVSAQGCELRFAVNYLSGYLLTQQLLPLIEKSAPARIVNVASLGQQPLDFDDLLLEVGYDGSRAYAQSKLAQIMFTIDLARELAGKNITVNSLHPATYMDTGMVRAAGVEPRSTVAEGAAAVLYVATAPELDGE